MNRILLGCVLGLGLALGLSAEQATGQVFLPKQGGPPLRPPVSPYLNLVNGFNGNTAINYYGIVRPQIDFARQLQMLQFQQQGYYNPQFGVLDAEDGTMGTHSVTGHPTVFFNYGHYFGQQGLTNGGLNQPPGAVNRTRN